MIFVSLTLVPQAVYRAPTYGNYTVTYGAFTNDLGAGTTAVDQGNPVEFEQPVQKVRININLIVTLTDGHGGTTYVGTAGGNSYHVQENENEIITKMKDAYKVFKL